MCSSKSKLCSINFNILKFEPKGFCDTVKTLDMSRYIIEDVGQDNIMRLIKERLEFELKKSETELSEL